MFHKPLGSTRKVHATSYGIKRTYRQLKKKGRRAPYTFVDQGTTLNLAGRCNLRLVGPPILKILEYLPLLGV